MSASSVSTSAPCSPPKEVDIDQGCVTLATPMSLTNFNDLPTEIAIRILALAITTPAKSQTYRSLVCANREMRELALYACLPHVPVALVSKARFESFSAFLDSHPIVRGRIRSVWFAADIGAATEPTFGVDILQKCSGIARIACSGNLLKAFVAATVDFTHHDLKDVTLIESEICWREYLRPPIGRQLFTQLTHLRITRDVNFDLDIDFCFTSLTHLSFKADKTTLSSASASVSDLTRFPVLKHIVPSVPYLQWRLLQPMTLRVSGRALDERMDVIACSKKWNELGVWEDGGPGERDLWDRAKTTEFVQSSRTFADQRTTRYALFGFTIGRGRARRFSRFCIDDRDHGHPIPKCSNPSVEKWTLDDMLDRWVMRSLDHGIDGQFQSILLSTYESFSTPMDLFQGLHQRFQAAEKEVGHPQLWVSRRLDILSRILHWVESPFAPTDPQVIAQMKTFTGLIVSAKYSPSPMRAKANGIQAVLEQKEQQLSRVVIANQQPADLRPLRRLSAKEIATTLTALERFMRQGIHPADYMAYSRNLDRPGAKRVADAHRLAEGIKHWVLRKVLYPDEVAWRRKNLKLFFEVAGECWQARNFATATTILRVLNSGVLRRLPETFAELDAERPNRLRELTRLVQSHLKDGTPFDPNTPCMAHMESRLRGLTAILPKCSMARDRECPEGWVNISSCQDLAEIMLEIAKLQMSVERVDSDDRSLVYLWQFAQVEAGAADDHELERRSEQLAKEEDSQRFQRAITVQNMFKRSLSAASGRPVPPNA